MTKHPRKIIMLRCDLQLSLLNAKTGLATSLHTLCPGIHALLTAFPHVWLGEGIGGRRAPCKCHYKICFKGGKRCNGNFEILEVALESRQWEYRNFRSGFSSSKAV
jgi:hypothetical protein